MATSMIPCQHARSISLPSRPHLTKTQFDENLSRLRSSESASTSSSCITHNLNSLKDLYECVDDLLLLSSDVHALSQDGKATDEILEATLCLLDVCGGARDALVQIRERVQDIQSVLRRRCSGDLSTAKEAAAYLQCRREVKKEMRKLVKEIRNVQKKCTSFLEKNNGQSLIANTLMEMQLATAEILTSLLAYVGGSTKSRLSLVSKLIHQGQKKEAAGNTSEFEEIDATLQSIISQKNFNITQPENVQALMGNLDLTIQDFDEILESLFRCFVKFRANLLNVVTH